MFLKEFYKEKKAYTFDMHNAIIRDITIREKELVAEGYMPVFDRRELTFNNGRGGTAILENDHTPPNTVLELQEEITTYTNPEFNTHKQYCNLHPDHVTELNQLIKDRQVKTILIDSLFHDVDQFRYMVKHVFSSHTEINFIIRSYGRLIKLLNDEVANNMDKYEVRNPYYTYTKDGQSLPYFNDLTFTLMKNNVYEADAEDVMTRIKFVRDFKTGIEVSYGNKFKFIRGSYKSEDGDPEKTGKSKWL